MTCVNKVILIGNVGHTPTIETLKNGDGNEVAKLSLATTDVWKDKQTGEKKEKTEWHRVIVFSPGLINVIKVFVKKGSKLYIEGSLQTRKYIGRDNVEKYTTEIILNNFNSTLQILSSKDNKNADDMNVDEVNNYI